MFESFDLDPKNRTGMARANAGRATRTNKRTRRMAGMAGNFLRVVKPWRGATIVGADI
jgi:hypothetical protein